MPTAIAVPQVEYHVITRETAESKLDQNPAYVALSWEDYLLMSQFERDKLSYTEKLHLVIKYYEEVLEDGDAQED